MTISTTSASQLVSGDGSTTTFQFGFIADSSSDVTVTSIATNGTMTLLNPSQYTLLINPANPNQLWGIGGNIVYPISGSPIPAGQQLLIQRTLPLTQETSVQNQGNYFAQVTEQALDTLCMEIQQVSARTGQMRGTWATGVAYNFGDVVVDGANGANTGNYYMCAIANTSGVWATDLGNGDWSLVINIQNINAVVGAYLPLIGGTISGNLTVAGTLNPSGGVTPSSIAASALVGTDIVKVGAITTGTWNAGIVTAPSVAVTSSSAPSNGFFYPASHTIGTSVNGVQRTQVNSTGIYYNTTTFPSSSQSGILIGDPGQTSQCIASVGAISTASPMWQFMNKNGNVGSISTLGNATTYATSSDYRLKENVVTYTGGISVIQQLRPVSFDWISGGAPDYGFIAHELGVIIPHACVGVKDAVDVEGNIIPQSIDTSFIITHLVSAVQDMQNRLIQHGIA